MSNYSHHGFASGGRTTRRPVRADAAVAQIRRDADAARQRFAGIRTVLAERLRFLARTASAAIRVDAERAVETVRVEPDEFNGANLPAIRQRVNERVAAAVGRLMTAALDELRRELTRATDEGGAVFAGALAAARAALDAALPATAGPARHTGPVGVPGPGGDFTVMTDWVSGVPSDTADADTFESVAGFLVVASGAVALATAGIGAGVVAALGAFGVLSWLEEVVKGPKAEHFREQCKAGVAERLDREASPEAIFERLGGPAGAHLDRLRAEFDAEIGGLVSDFADAVAHLRRDSHRLNQDASQFQTLDRLAAEVGSILNCLEALPPQGGPGRRPGPPAESTRL